MKKYTRKHGIIIAEGVLIEKPKTLYTRWNKLLDGWKQEQERYHIGIEENCLEYIFIYNKQNCIISDILQLQAIELPVYERSVNFETFINNFEELKDLQPKMYVVHYWR